MPDKRMTEDEVVAELEDGMTIGIGGWGSRRKPMSLVRAILRRVPRETRLIVNGDPSTARRASVGLHLAAATPNPWGHDAPPAGLLFGRSVHDEEETRCAVASGAVYLVAGHVYATDSKPGIVGRGIELIRRLRPPAGGRPLYAIGGVTPDRIGEQNAILDARRDPAGGQRMAAPPGVADDRQAGNPPAVEEILRSPRPHALVDAAEPMVEQPVAGPATQNEYRGGVEEAAGQGEHGDESLRHGAGVRPQRGERQQHAARWSEKGVDRVP